MYRRSLITLSLVIAFCVASLSCSAEIVKIVVDDTIHPISAEYIGRGIQEAERTHADALLIEINTPGGLVDSTRDIVREILAAKVPVIIYVTPAGSYAASAGFYILESADVAAMSPGTNTGAAHPVRGDGVTMDPVMKEKLENDSAALLRSYSGKRGRNVEIAESAVRQSKSFSADEALSNHLIDYLAKDENDLFKQVDGKTITRFDDSKQVLHVAGKPVRMFDLTVREKVLSWLMDPNFTFLLFAIGMMALYAEFNHPGAVVPGVIGFVFVLLALFAFHILPTRYAALVLIIGAFVLFALEAKFQTHGVLTIGGIAIMVLGALLLVDGPIPEMRVRWVTALSVSIPLGLITVFLMTIALKARQNKITTGEQGMIGEIGIVHAPLTPSGKVFVHGELWDATAPSTIEVGRNVVVRKVHDLTLTVEPAPSSDRVAE
ncbi:MAG TPA: nodulation protein NfeD [Candidatus Angelobacter sp.]|jgi:membrane-bound serine protease (ClpP class)|nr:nodulation protein NfeD [Candidatus Angelobacter sp.]